VVLRGLLSAARCA